MKGNGVYKFGIAFAMLIIISACVQKEKPASVSGQAQPELFGEVKTQLDIVEAPAGFDWRQCDGMVLNFIVENNINANILSRECEKFTAATGIKVNIRSFDFTTLTEKINMEFISKTDEYELIYVDPYQTLTRFTDCLEDLYRFEEDETLPHLVGGLEQFYEEQLEVCSFFENKERLYSIPFDATTMIMFYRQDIFDQYQLEMERDLGYRPIPGAPGFTWERYIEVSDWITGHVPDDEIRYGSLTMSARHNSIYTEFSSLLAAYGGDYFDGETVTTLGVASPGELKADEAGFVKALSVYQQIAGLNPKPAREWNWTEVNQAFQNGEVAMMLNWDENAAAVENPRYSSVSGKVGYALLPRGSRRSANIYGGSGIGINKHAAEEKKLAAWLFIVWATSPQVQMKTLLEEGGGNMPIRKDVYRLIESRYIGVLPHAAATVAAQQRVNAYYRPKIRNGYDFENIIITNISDMIRDQKDCRDVYLQIKSQWYEMIQERQQRDEKE